MGLRVWRRCFVYRTSATITKSLKIRAQIPLGSRAVFYWLPVNAALTHWPKVGGIFSNVDRYIKHLTRNSHALIFLEQMEGLDNAAPSIHPFFEIGIGCPAQS